MSISEKKINSQAGEITIGKVTYANEEVLLITLRRRLINFLCDLGIHKNPEYKKMLAQERAFNEFQKKCAAKYSHLEDRFK